MRLGRERAEESDQLLNLAFGEVEGGHARLEVPVYAVAIRIRFAFKDGLLRNPISHSGLTRAFADQVGGRWSFQSDPEGQRRKTVVWPT
ncbi:MAG: hypothetical protein U0Q18_16720 [Bryobacteraceae bacterium]